MNPVERGTKKKRKHRPIRIRHSAFRIISLCLPPAAFCLLPTGCRVGPDYHPPEQSMPAAWQPATRPSTRPTTLPSMPTTQAAPVGDWWHTFRDPDLDWLIDHAVHSNLDLQLAEARVREARYERDVVAGKYYPGVDADASYTHLRISKNGLPLPTGSGSGNTQLSTGQIAAASSSGGSTGAAAATGSGGSGGLGIGPDIDLYQVGFDATWELDVFGRFSREVETANDLVEAGIETRRDVLVSLLAEVARDYIELRGQQRQLAIARENLDIQKQSLELTQQRRNVGMTNDLDVARAESQVAFTASSIPAMTARIEQSRHRLAVLLGMDPTALASRLSQSADIPHPPAHVPVGLPSQLLLRRPDIRHAERQLAAATARIGVATSDLFPRFSLTGSFGLQSESPSDLLDWDSHFYNIGPSMNWPIFQGNRIRSNIKVQDTRQQQALIEYHQTILTALRETDDALSAITHEQRRREQLEKSLKAEKHAVNVAQQLYAQGLTDFLSVLDAQRSLFAIQQTLAQSQEAVSTDLVALYKALGGGWEHLETPPQTVAAKR
jgi:NodT family efflux transporter outer membrane factor (OMF) lipoprotein